MISINYALKNYRNVSFISGYNKTAYSWNIGTFLGEMREGNLDVFTSRLMICEILRDQC